MAFPQPRVLPQTSLLDVNAVNSPYGFQPVVQDRSNTLLGIEQVKLAQQQEKRLQEDFEWRKAKEKTALRNSLTGFTAGVKGDGKSGLSGLIGLNDYTQRVKEKVDEYVIEAQSALASTEDPNEWARIEGDVKAKLMQDPDYMKALEQEQMISGVMNKLLEEDNIDGAAAQQLAKDLRQNVNPKTGMYIVGMDETTGQPIEISVLEKVLGTDVQMADAPKLLEAMVAQFNPQKTVEQYVEGTTVGTAEVQYFAAPAKVREAAEQMFSGPQGQKNLRAFQRQYGISGADEQEVLQNAINFVTDAVTDDRGTYIDEQGNQVEDPSKAAYVRRVEGVKNLKDISGQGLETQLTLMDLENKRSQIMLNRAKAFKEMYGDQQPAYAKLNEGGEEAKKAAASMGAVSQDLVYNFGGQSVVNATSEAAPEDALPAGAIGKVEDVAQSGRTVKYGLVDEDNNTYFKAERHLGAKQGTKGELQTVEGTLYTTNKQVADLARQRGMTVTTTEKPNSIEGVTKFNTDKPVWSIKAVTTDVPGIPSYAEDLRGVTGGAPLSGAAFGVLEYRESSGGSNIVNRNDSGKPSLSPLQFRDGNAEDFMDELGITYKDKDGQSLLQRPLTEEEGKMFEQQMYDKAGGKEQLIKRARTFFQTNLLPRVGKMMTETFPGVNLDEEAVKIPLYSFTVNHGTKGKAKMLANVYQKVGPNPTTPEFIAALQEERRRYVLGLNSLKQSEKEHLVKRYREEQVEAEVVAGVRPVTDLALIDSPALSNFLEQIGIRTPEAGSNETLNPAVTQTATQPGVLKQAPAGAFNFEQAVSTSKETSQTQPQRQPQSQSTYNPDVPFLIDQQNPTRPPAAVEQAAEQESNQEDTSLRNMGRGNRGGTIPSSPTEGQGEVQGTPEAPGIIYPDLRRTALYNENNIREAEEEIKKLEEDATFGEDVTEELAAARDKYEKSLASLQVVYQVNERRQEEDARKSRQAQESKERTDAKLAELNKQKEDAASRRQIERDNARFNAVRDTLRKVSTTLGKADPNILSEGLILKGASKTPITIQQSGDNPPKYRVKAGGKQLGKIMDLAELEEFLLTNDQIGSR